MQTIKPLTAGAIAATTAIASTLIAFPAKAQLSTQSNTNMQVVLPSVLILYYYNTVTLNVSITDLINGAAALHPKKQGVE
ncbi:hypothetical protein ACQ4M4_25675 [Leptolyngbya sp. AN02str]|uniref:hypothetical protein n=1 Tax=Leptolyngbya sp. AN02str TaxID=3423363 RepID=UPI003D310EAC